MGLIQHGIVVMVPEDHLMLIGIHVGAMPFMGLLEAEVAQLDRLLLQMPNDAVVGMTLPMHVADDDHDSGISKLLLLTRGIVCGVFNGQ